MSGTPASYKTTGRVPLAVLWIAVTLLAIAAAGTLALRSGLQQLNAQAEADLSLASDRLANQLQRYRQIPVILARERVLVDALDAGQGNAAHLFLRRIADQTGAQDLFLLDRQGGIVAQASTATPGPAGADLKADRLFRRALNGALGTYHGVGPDGAPRGIYFAHPVRGEGADVRGVLTIKADLEALEAGWRADPQIIFFSDAAGVIFITNRYGLLFARVEGQGVAPFRAAQYPDNALQPMPDYQSYSIFGHELWGIGPVRGDLPRWGLHRAQPMPVIGMTAQIIVDAAPVFAQVRLWVAFALAGAIALGLLGLVIHERRRRLAVALEVEARAKAELEELVTARTADLERSNVQLRREVTDRRAAEEALRRTQDDLVQAGKLSALGQMSAGISHELNQPLAAIRSYAENAELLLDRGDELRTRENLGQISRMAARMARIIKNLRAFARKDGAEAEVGVVALDDAVAGAVELASLRAEREGIEITWEPPLSQIFVRGGDVRLGQVVLNLISNAMDALAASEDKRIILEIEEIQDKARLSVIDSGPGLEDPSKLFEPFYTTKPVGAGTGLGLAISYGIVQSFGGNIRGETLPEGGARFVVELEAAPEPAKAVGA